MAQEEAEDLVTVIAQAAPEERQGQSPEDLVREAAEGWVPREEPVTVAAPEEQVPAFPAARAVVGVAALPVERQA